MIVRLKVIFLCLLLGACGTNNAFDCATGWAKSKCSQRTKDEEARLALDRGDLDEAITLLSELVESEPDVYTRYPLLAAAYAGRSGFDVLNVVTANFGGNSSILQTMSSFLPTPVTRGDQYDDSIADMKFGVDTILNIPEGSRLSTSADKYATSAVLQLTIYQSAYAVMLLNKFTYSTIGYDPSLLSTMTEADAAMILESLAGAVTAASGSSGAASSASSAISAIQGQQGSSDRDRLANWSQAAR